MFRTGKITASFEGYRLDGKVVPGERIVDVPTICPVTSIHWWQWHPPVGLFIALLAILGVLVPLLRSWDKIDKWEKAVWTLLMFILVGLEIRTLYLDRDEHDREQAFATCQQLESFTRIATILGNAISSSQSQFSVTMKQFTLDEKASQNRFSATMKAFSKTEKANQTRFDRSFAHEEQLAEGQTGVLKPGNDPTPSNSCSVPPGATMVFLGEGNVSWFSKIPHTIVLSQKHGPVVSVQKLSNDLITLRFDLRSPDGKIIARMNDNGYVINRNNTLEIQKTSSRLRVTDLYGSDVLDVRYVNPHAIVAEGSIFVVQGSRNTCLGESRIADVLIQ